MKCKDCELEMVEIDFTQITEIEHNREKDGRAYECTKCGNIEIDIKTSLKIKREMNTLKDKTIKIDGTVWKSLNEFVRENKNKYPSMKYFAQIAILEKLRKG